ncbi:MAG: MFS transporter [Chlamydiota bacterium]
MENFSRARALFAVYFIAAIDNCGYAMVFALFPPLLLDPEYGFLQQNPSVGERLLAMGVLYAAFPIAQLIGAPLIGDLADQYGRKKIFYLTIIGTIGAYVFTGWVLLSKSILLLFFARFLTGLFSGNQGLCNASIADLSPDAQKRAKNYGILTVVWGISFPVALILGGFLSDPSVARSFSPSLPFYITGGITALSLLTLTLFFQETFPQGSNTGKMHLLQGVKNIFEALRIKSTKPCFSLLLLLTLGWGFSITWYGAYVLQQFGVSQEMATLGLMIRGLGWTLGGAFLKPLLLRTYSIWQIGKISYWSTTTFLFLAACMPTFFSFIAVYAFSAVANAVSLSSSFNFISLRAPSHMQGKAMGIAQSMISLGFFLVPILGALTGSISVATFYPVAALFLCLGSIVLGRIEKIS